ncbi:MAG: hypothetical protein V2B19_31975 [Pseudomonadota bacterium]
MVPEISAFLRLNFKTLRIAAFFPLLQQGFHIPIPGSCSIRELLCDICGLSAEQVTTRIQTIFLNGMPVDNLETAVVGDGDTLALSAAMPGLVGATMRSGGVLACFRNTISHQGHTAEIPTAGILSIKLFNLLIKEFGPLFLCQGVLVSAETIKNMLALLTVEDLQACTGATLDQRVMDPARLSALNLPGGEEMVHLRVDFQL